MKGENNMWEFYESSYCVHDNTEYCYYQDDCESCPHRYSYEDYYGDKADYDCDSYFDEY